MDDSLSSCAHPVNHQVVSTCRAAQMLDCSPRTVLRFIIQKKLRAQRVGAHWKIFLSSIERLIQPHEAAPSLLERQAQQELERAKAALRR